MFIITALLVSFAAIVLDWQKDKSSFMSALKSNWLKYTAMFVISAFFAGYVLGIAAVRIILVATGIYFAWSLIVNLFKKKS
jgi:hypothetical protein